MTTPAAKTPGEIADRSPENRGARGARAAAVAAGLRRYNEWRRGADIKPPNPAEVGELIDAAVEVLEWVSRHE